MREGRKLVAGFRASKHQTKSLWQVPRRPQKQGFAGQPGPGSMKRVTNLVAGPAEEGAQHAGGAVDLHLSRQRFFSGSLGIGVQRRSFLPKGDQRQRSATGPQEGRPPCLAGLRCHLDPAPPPPKPYTLSCSTILPVSAPPRQMVNWTLRFLARFVLSERVRQLQVRTRLLLLVKP